MSESKSTAKDLIELLQQVPPDTLVVLAKDAEGNGFSPWGDEYALGQYEPETTWSGEFHWGEDGLETDAPEGAVPAIVLWPTN